MKTKLSGLLTLLLVLMAQITFAQDRTITGTVSDENGPLPGVSVVKVGTSTGTESDFDGNFTIQAKTGDQLRFSFVGMASVTRTVSDQSTLNVTMVNEDNTLDEVVVVAYGTQTKKSIVGSVGKIDTDVIQKQQTISAASALQGTVSGVSIIQAGGQPGDNPTIRIRGVNSVNASASPLIVVDGAPFNGNLNSISSDQIESMSVLKDASSTALYGSRGANGVIVITTKRGSRDMPVQVSVNAMTGVANQAVDFHKLIDTDTFTEYTWEALYNKSLYVDNSSPAIAAQYASDNLVSTLGYNPYGVANPVGTDGQLVTTNKNWDNDWSDGLFNDNALRQEYGFNVTGGSDKTNYFFGTNYVNQEGAVKTSNFERVTVRANIDSEINDWFSTGLNVFYSTSHQNYPTQSGSSYQSAQQWYYSVSSYYPTFKRDSNGDLVLDQAGNRIYDYGDTGGQAVNGVRPVFEGENGVGALYNYKIRNKRDLTSVNGYGKITFSDHINFRTQLSYEKYLFDEYNYVHNQYGYAANVGGRVSQDRDVTTTTNWINSLNYNQSFGNHNLGANLIMEAYERNNDYLGAQGVGFLPNVKVLNGSTTPEGVSGAFTDETLLSYLGRVQYNYDSKYYIEGSFRRDGSSRFSEDTRWGNFFSVGGSWIISQENFLSSSDVISFLKLKASYGELGNNNLTSYFPYLSLFETGWNELNNTGVLLGDVADPNLTWETTASSNIGIDFGLFNDRLNGTIDFYEKESKDLIFGKPLPISTGNSSITTNVGAISNRGVEIDLNGVIVRNENWDWTANLNITHNKNEILELTQDEIINGTKKWQVGKSLYEFFIQEYAGVDPQTGRALWYMDEVDGSGQPTGQKTTTDQYSQADRYYTGKSSLPDFTGGLSTFVRFKNFDLNVLFNYSFGSYVYDSSYGALMGSMESVGRAGSQDLVKRWQQPGDVTDVPMLLASSNDFNSTSDRFLFKNDYIRLKALNFGYNFSPEILEKFGLTKFRLFFQGDNLFTWQSHDGLDPEQSFAGTTNSRSYNQKIVSFGVNVQF